MMLCVDKKMLHEPLPGHECGPPGMGAENGSNGGPEHLRDAQAGPVPAEAQPRHDVLTRVVRISDALNQRLAL
jgi:hypothetical protein